MVLPWLQAARLPSEWIYFAQVGSSFKEFIKSATADLT